MICLLGHKFVQFQMLNCVLGHFPAPDEKCQAQESHQDLESSERSWKGSTCKEEVQEVLLHSFSMPRFGDLASNSAAEVQIPPKGSLRNRD